MPVYSYHYGASNVSAIGVQAVSPELTDIKVLERLRQLSSMHALDSTDYQGEMLSYLTDMEGYELLGVAYQESPKSSGYNRTAPCGIAYVYQRAQIPGVVERLGGIINFVTFSKPGTSSPAPLADIPLAENGFCYHNRQKLLADLVNVLCYVALQGGEQAMLVGLPKGKKNAYATARYTLAEAVRYMPAALRGRIRFFTGLPVKDSEKDPQQGLDNARRLGANVIFCAADQFKALIANPIYGVDMDAPNEDVGQYAAYISTFPDPSAALARIEEHLVGDFDFNALNEAAEKARTQQGKADTAAERLREREEKFAGLEAALAGAQEENKQLRKKYRKLKDDLELDGPKKSEAAVVNSMQAEIPEPAASAAPQGWGREDAPKAKRSKGLGKKILIWVVSGLVALGIAGGLTWFFLSGRGGSDQPAPTAVVTAEPTAVSGPTEQPGDLVQG